MNTRRSTTTFIFIVLTAALLASCSQPAAPTPTPDPERTERYTAYFNEADINGDGIVDEAEIDAVAAVDFDAMDFNDDRVVTIEDVHNEAQGEPEDAARNLDLASHLPYDGDGDGGITPQEYEAYLDAELLAKMDKTGDGQIGFDEYRTYEAF